jgi:uncharacterized protein YuzE
MRIVPTYSAEADTAYFAFGDAREVAETVAPIDDIAIDFDSSGRIVGIELVTASRYLDPSVFDQDPYLEELIGVTEIAEYLGKHKQNVAQHYTRRPDFPNPVAELPTGRYWRRGDVQRWYERIEPAAASERRAQLTPEELARELELDREEVIRITLQEGIPMYQGRIDRKLFLERLRAVDEQLKSGGRRRKHLDPTQR